MAAKLYPHATHITDIYHAREHLHDLANHLAFITPDPAAWLETRSTELDAGNIEAIIAAARRYPLTGVKAAELDTKVGYFEHNIHRMRYQHFRDLGMFIGSGHIEAGCKAIVVQRAKQSGMHWTVDQAVCCSGWVRSPPRSSSMRWPWTITTIPAPSAPVAIR